VITGLGVAWVARSLVGEPLTVTWVLRVYVVLRVVVLVVLAAPGWLAPDFPLALLGLLVLDAPGRLGRLRWPLAGLAIAVLQVLASATEVSSVQFGPAMTGAVVTVSALLVGAVMLIAPSKVISVGTVITAVLAAPLWTAAPARAHDPGQGPSVGTAELVVNGNGAGHLSVFVRDITVTTGSPDSARLVARRAGRTVNATLERSAVPGSRAFAGLITLPDAGLWFLYAELRDGQRTLETWLPVHQNVRGLLVQERMIYEPAGIGARPAGEYIAGGLLLVVGAALAGWAAVSVRRASRRPEPTADPADPGQSEPIADTVDPVQPELEAEPGDNVESESVAHGEKDQPDETPAAPAPQGNQAV
jgi:hypothetical protein